jgi:hypothetical protein
VTTFFCDGIKEVTILNGVARLEFHRLQTGGTASNRDVQAVSEMIIALPTQGFLQALSVLEGVRDQLVREGVLKPNAEGAAPGPTTPSRSPNFA